MNSNESRASLAEQGRLSRFSSRFRGLSVQIVLWTVLPLTLVLIGVAFTGVYSHEQTMRDLVQERDQALAVVGASQVQDLFEARVAALEALAAEQAFHHGDSTTQTDLLTERGDLNGLFADSVWVLDEAGNPLASAEPPSDLVQDERMAALTRSVMAQQKPAVSQLSTTPMGNNVMLLGVPVFDESGVTSGVLVGPISFDNLGLENLLGQVQVGEQGAVYLVDDSGKILARPVAEQGRSDFAGHTGINTALQDEEAGATLCHAPDGERMTLAYAPVEFGDLGWRVLIEEPWHEVIGPVLRYSQFMPLVAVLAVIVSVLALYYGIRSIVRPLQALGQQAERVAWGDFEATSLPVGGVEEIEDLRRTLDQMARRIQNYQRGMHDYIAAITEGQEEERRRLARELHDDTAQALIALNQQAEMAQKLLDTDPELAAERLAQIREMLAEILEGVRRFSRALRPIYLEDLGFLPALEMLTREAEQEGSLSVHFAVSGLVRRLPPYLELAAYRIIQEALNNVLQHADASQAWVEVHFEEEHLGLTVRDNGQGFEVPDLPDSLARMGHFGLMGIQERALLYGGRMTIRSVPDQGTEVLVRMPYRTREKPRQMAG